MMRDNKKKFSIIMVAIFTTFILVSGLEASAVPKKVKAQVKVSVVTNYVVTAEKAAKVNNFTVKLAQQAVSTAQKQVNKITNKGIRNSLIKRLNNIQKAINARVKFLADQSKMAAANAAKLKVAVMKVTTLETAACSDLTVQSNLARAEAAVNPAKVEVAKLPSGTSKTALTGRLDAAVVTITNARAAFDAKVKETHDVTTLSAVIVSAKALNDGAAEGTADGDYAVGSKTVLQAAITAAQTVVDNAQTTSQKDIDAAAATLNAAITAFNNGLVVTHDVTTLSAIIVSAKALYAGATEGTVDGSYTIGSKDILQAAITTAEAIAMNAQTTSQKDIDAAAAALNTTVTAFNNGLVVTHDATTLSAIIVSANTLYDGAVEGTADGNYSAGSKAVLQSAITTAQAIAMNAQTTSQKDIDAAAAALNAAVKTFNGSLVATHDVTTLSAVIMSAVQLHDGAVEGTESGNYAVGSKAVLQTAIDAAETVDMNAQTTSQKDIDAAVTALNAAVTVFNNGKVQ